MFTKLFSMPDFAVSAMDESETERLTKVIAADRMLRRERARWGLRRTRKAQQ